MYIDDGGNVVVVQLTGGQARGLKVANIFHRQAGKCGPDGRWCKKIKFQMQIQMQIQIQKLTYKHKYKQGAMWVIP